MSTLLYINDLHVAYGGGRLPVLHGVNLQLDAGRTLGVVGESGSGKSTLAQAVVQLLPAGAVQPRGQIRFDGQDLLQLREPALRALRGRDIAMILQDPMSSLNPLLDIGTQVAEVGQRHLGLSRRAAWQQAIDLLTAMKITEPAQRLREYPHQLSGGMRQRVAGAIALAARPRLLIADEPTTALDPTVQVQYLHLLASLQRAQGFALLLITHDLGIVAHVCDDVAVMYAGSIVEQGPAREVLTCPRHPYTQALVASLPSLQARAGSLHAIAGQPPRPGQHPGGCAFHPRCRLASARCAEAAPSLTAIPPHGALACWHPAPHASANPLRGTA